MARFRIVQRPSYIDPTQIRFDIEEKTWWRWQYVTFEFNLEDAETYILNIESIRKNRVKAKVIKEYVL